MDQFIQFLTHTTTIFGFGVHNWVLIAVGIIVVWLAVLLPGLKI